MANYNTAFQGMPGNISRYSHDFGPSDTSSTVPAILVVDSSERNRDIHENPGQYTYNFIKGYKEVVKVQLVKANVPSSGYVVMSSNRVVTFTYDAVQYSINLTIGNYTSDELAAELQLRMNDACGFADTDPVEDRFLVEVDELRAALRVTSPAAGAEIVFIAGATNNADNIIGLGTDDATSTFDGTSHVVTLPNSFNLNPDRYIILCIRGLERCDSNSSAIQGSFCIIPFDSTTENFAIGQDNDCINIDSYTYYFTEPLPKFTKMEITFLKRDGSVYDFNGRDHFMVFQITSLSRAQKR